MSIDDPRLKYSSTQHQEMVDFLEFVEKSLSNSIRTAWINIKLPVYNEKEHLSHIKTLEKDLICLEFIKELREIKQEAVRLVSKLEQDKKENENVS